MRRIWEVFHLDDMENVEMKNFLPTDLAYDMNFHILSFAPGASHSFVETHIQEHGMYILEGEGVYLLDEDWRLIKKGDFVWFGPYCPQAAYAAGRTRYTYIYSKDCNLGRCHLTRFPQPVPSKKTSGETSSPEVFVLC